MRKLTEARITSKGARGKPCFKVLQRLRNLQRHFEAEVFPKLGKEQEQEQEHFTERTKKGVDVEEDKAEVFPKLGNEQEQEQENPFGEIEDIEIEKLDLSIRTYNILKREKVNKTSDLILRK